MPTEILLEWKGPHSLLTDDTREYFLPPEYPGVYLWCVGKQDSFLISYVGRASNLQKRMYEHIFWMLGGRYDLYGDDHFLEGAPPKSEYIPSFKNLLTDFVKDFSNRSSLAYRNLTLYTYFWATIRKDWRTQIAVESAIIEQSKKLNQPLQNDRLSLRPENSPHLLIRSHFESNTFPGALSKSIYYGFGVETT
ncbi:hypothetical protein [Desulfonatronospira sp.]|uniref:hypothetical protein n=1 Tax=Desulfonatronospira sp. TaxID=1962951 RepID=UPI0025BDE67E|nr:hypothetical protein [Desulfonatronospira sp.]